MGQLGKLRSLDDLPRDEILLSLINEAVALNEKGIKPSSANKPKTAPVIPTDFNAVEWIAYAKHINPDRTRESTFQRSVLQSF